MLFSLITYCTQENFGGRIFWQLITAEAIGEESLDKSAGLFHWQEKIGKLYTISQICQSFLCTV